MHTSATPDYMNPGLPEGLNLTQIPVVKATNETVKDYGCLINNPDDFKIEITRWPGHKAGGPLIWIAATKAALKKAYFTANGKAIFYMEATKLLAGNMLH